MSASYVHMYFQFHYPCLMYFHYPCLCTRIFLSFNPVSFNEHDIKLGNFFYTSRIETSRASPPRIVISKSPRMADSLLYVLCEIETAWEIATFPRDQPVHRTFWNFFLQCQPTPLVPWSQVIFLALRLESYGQAPDNLGPSSPTWPSATVTAL